MSRGFVSQSPLTRAEMEEFIDTLQLSKRDKRIIVLAEGLFGEKPVSMRQICKRFKIDASRGGHIKKFVFEKMATIKLRKEIIECVRAGKPIFKFGREESKSE